MSALNACGLSWQPLVPELGECALSQGMWIQSKEMDAPLFRVGWAAVRCHLILTVPRGMAIYPAQKLEGEEKAHLKELKSQKSFSCGWQ